jgi:DNA repair exonuclease SbcCD ATPase subunit
MSLQGDIIKEFQHENYYDSAFCLCETGGAWYGEKPFIPLLSPPVNYGDLRGALYGKQATLLDSVKGLNEMYDELRAHLDGEDHGVARWNARRDKFLNRLPELLKLVGKPAGLKAAEANVLRKELAELKKSYEDLDTDLETAKEQIVALEKAKSPADVKRIKREFSGEDEEFKQLLRTASAEMHKLSRVVREAVYSYFSERPLPGELDIDTALDEKFLYEGEHGPSLRDDHPKVKKALEALGELRDFMESVDSNPDSTLRAEYEDENQDLFVFTNKNFWSENGLL